MADKAEKKDNERAKIFQGLNEVVWKDFGDVRKEPRMHQRNRFIRQFEQLHSRRGKVDAVVGRSDYPRTCSSSLVATAQELLKQGRDEAPAELAGNVARESGGRGTH